MSTNNEVLFFRRGKSYYFRIDGMDYYELNSINLNKLKEQLVAPYIIKFYGLSRAQVSRVLTDLLDKDVQAKIHKISNQTDAVVKYEVECTKPKYVIDAYKMTNTSCLYGRKTDCNPYILTEMLDRKVLIEVPKDYIKTNMQEYYFLASNLTNIEQTLFSSCHHKIECDGIYNLDNSLIETRNKIKVVSPIKKKNL